MAGKRNPTSVIGIHDLVYIIAIYEFSHVGKAADWCCISQPTISIAVKKVESVIGFDIFVRDRQGNRSLIYATDEGLAFIEKAKKVLDAFNDLRDIKFYPIRHESWKEDMEYHFVKEMILTAKAEVRKIIAKIEAVK